MKIELHIDKLVLHGFAQRDSASIGAAIREELARLFTEHGVPPSLMRGREVARVDGGAFEMAPGSKAGTIGSQVAQRVYGGLRR